MNKKIIFALLTIGLFFIVGCKGGDSGSTTTPFLGGSTGVFIEFVEGSPPEEVTDKSTFDFDILVSLRNDGEFDISKEDIKVSLLGVSPEDFGTSLGELKDQNPEDDLIGRSRDTEGNIIEGTPIYVEFPKEDDQMRFVSELVGDRKEFTFRADVCYNYQTIGMAQYCVLRDLINVREDSICDPSESKTVYSSGAPVQLSNFKQSVVGKDKIGFSFDVVHRGNGYVFEYGESDSPAATCPSDSSARRRNKDRVRVTVEPGIGSITCSGLNGNSDFVMLVDGKRSIMCTLTLSSDRSDFEKELKITLDYNYEDDKDTVVLVKHLLE